MKKVDKMIELIESEVNKGIYIYGGNGEDVSAMTDTQRKTFMEKREVSTKGTDGSVKYTKEQNIARDEALFQTRKNHGINPIRAFDCSGLMYWAGKQVEAIKKDISANGLFNQCKEVTKNELEKGDFCFKHNGSKATHVGQYAGDGIIIECQGRDVGVVKTKLSKTKVFNRFGRLAALSGDIPGPEPEPPEPPVPPEPQPTKYYVLVKGKVRSGMPDKSINVRAGNGVYKDEETGEKNAILGVAHSMDLFPYLGTATEDPFWYIIDYKGVTAYISSLEKYTEVVEK